MPNVRQLPPRSENEWPQETPITLPKQDIFDSLRANPMGLVLLGIIIGVLIANMRPVIIKN